MGNCVFKGMGGISELEVVKVVTSSGGIMELYAPITVESITNEFPGHAIFRRRRDLFSQPLLHSDELHPGELYYLLPLNPYNNTTTTIGNGGGGGGGNDVVVTPYRMSCEGHNAAKSKRSDHHLVFPRYNSGGVWKVKLVISPEQLSEILSQEARTEALIESVRTVAKCGSGGGGGASSVASSDQWSLSNSWKGS